MANGIQNSKPKARLLIMMTVLFFFWGLANNMTGTLLTTFKNVMDISNIQTYLIESAFYVAYFCFAIPATYYIYHYSYKSGILFGLAVYAVGGMLFFPAASMGNYYFYLTAIYIMAAGCAMLETLANPYILSLGHDINSGIRKLNLAQSVNPLGSITGILVSQTLILSNSGIDLGGTENPEIMREELDTITMVYASIGELLLIFIAVITFVTIPVSSKLYHASDAIPRFKYTASRIFKSGRFRGGLVAQFFYVGAQTGVWGYMTITAQSLTDVEGMDFSSLMMIATIGFCVARFIFTALMRRFSWSLLLLIAAIGALISSATVLFGSGITVVYALVMISVFMSLMFPTIFGAALENIGHETQMGSAFLIMSIVGGAVIAPLQGLIANSVSPQMSFIVPAICFIVIAVFAGNIVLYTKK